MWRAVELKYGALRFLSPILKRLLATGGQQCTESKRRKDNNVFEKNVTRYQQFKLDEDEVEYC